MCIRDRFDYILNEIFEDKKPHLSKFLQFLKHCEEFHQIYMTKEICLISNFPKEIHRNNKGQLHNVNDLALRYRDGFGLFSVNGSLKNSLLETVMEECYNY